MALILRLNIQFRVFGSTIRTLCGVNIDKNGDIKQQLEDAAAHEGFPKNIYLLAPAGPHQDFSGVVDLAAGATLTIYVAGTVPLDLDSWNSRSFLLYCIGFSC
jgi:hypothetical protein